jgi:hypothetical protein
VTSTNGIANVSVEITNSTPDLSATTAQNYTLTLVGTPTSGNWMYVLNASEGVYQIMRAFATDNTSFVQTADYSQSFMGFRVQAQTPATTTTTSATIETTTTTSSSSTISTTTTSAAAQPNQQIGDIFNLESPIGKILAILTSNPIFLVILAMVLIVPLLILVYVIKKRAKNELYEVHHQDAK